MLSSRLLIVLLLVAGCSYQPLLQQQTKSSLSGAIEVMEISNNRLGYLLRTNLQQRLGSPASGTGAKMKLNTSISVAEIGLAITEAGDITRRRLRYTFAFSLTDVNDDKELLQGRESIIASYDATASQFAERAARRDVEKRAAIDIAERIARRVQMTLSEQITQP